MTGSYAACLHTNQSRSYLNHLVYWNLHLSRDEVIKCVLMDTVINWRRNSRSTELVKKHDNFSPAIIHDNPENKSDHSELRVSTSVVEGWLDGATSTASCVIPIGTIHPSLNYRGADKSLVRPGRKHATATKP